MNEQLKTKLQDKLLQLASYLRAREANALRGRPEELQQLEHVTNLALLTKWSWLAAIVAAVSTFAGLPLLLIILKPFLPSILNDILWLATKTAMAVACLLFASAIYLTFSPPSDI